MNNTRISIIVLFLAMLLASAWWSAKLIWLRPFNIDHFFERAYVHFLWNDPENLTATGILDKYGLSGHESLLTDASPKRTLELAEIGRKNLSLLKGYDREALSESQKVSFDIFHWFLTAGVEGEDFLFHDYPVTHISGPHLELPQFMIYTHPVLDADDADNYVARLGHFSIKFGQVIDGLAHRKELGIVPPTFILTDAIRQCDEFTALPPEENSLYTSFVQRLDKIQNLDKASKQQLAQRCKDQIIESVYPAYKRLSNYLLQLESSSLSIAGSWHLPNGDEYYRYCLKQHTTLEIEPEVLYQLGKLEMSRIEGEMRILLNMLQYPVNTSVSEIMYELSLDKTISFSPDSLGQAACMEHFKRTMNLISPKLPLHFNKQPKSKLEFHEVPERKSASSMLAFYLPPKGEPVGAGRLFVNTRKSDRLPYFLATTYAFHEGIPGHHLQKALQIEMTGLPDFRRFLPFTAYSEGWAMYAEELGHEILNTEDPYDKLGLLQSDLFRTVRLMTDLGIHHKKWLREQAVEFMMSNAAMSADEAKQEVDRYIVWPGQGCAYKVGKMKFLELRDRMKKTQGENFDQKAFHDLMIGHGSMPLAVLEAMVDDVLTSKLVE
jgi:uncharacterized protein (DUF885 family)